MVVRAFPIRYQKKRNPSGARQARKRKKKPIRKKGKGGKIGYDTTLSGEGKKAGKEARDAMQMRRVL